jgi:hypothetical protein
VLGGKAVNATSVKQLTSGIDRFVTQDSAGYFHVEASGRALMIFSNDLLFIHIPKTGGMSVSEYLMEVLPKPIYYAHPGFDESLVDRGVCQFAGIRHENMEEARGVVRQYGFELRSFPAILVVLRNPYSLEVSRYSYLRAGYPWDKGPNQKLALSQDFETFARLSTFHGGASRSIERYLLLDGAIPERLRILRFETLVEDVRNCLSSLGLPISNEFPWKNKSSHSDYRAYYTEAAEEAVFNRYRWVFEQEYYPRMTEEDLLVGRRAVQNQPWLPDAYLQLIQRVREEVDQIVPPSAVVAVVNRGDSRLRDFNGRRALDFPLDHDGTYAGYHPADSSEAIGHLRNASHCWGCEYLVFPSTAFWWLEYYADLKQQLDEFHEPLWESAHCSIYRITRTSLKKPDGKRKA